MSLIGQEPLLGLAEVTMTIIAAEVEVTLKHVDTIHMI